VKNIFVIFGHASKESFSKYLVQKYCSGAKEVGNDIRRINVSELE
jgi:putative NADPH-quinone reductase